MSWASCSGHLWRWVWNSDSSQLDSHMFPWSLRYVRYVPEFISIHSFFRALKIGFTWIGSYNTPWFTWLSAGQLPFSPPLPRPWSCLFMQLTEDWILSLSFQKNWDSRHIQEQQWHFRSIIFWKSLWKWPAAMPRRKFFWDIGTENLFLPHTAWGHPWTGQLWRWTMVLIDIHHSLIPNGFYMLYIDDAPSKPSTL